MKKDLNDLKKITDHLKSEETISGKAENEFNDLRHFQSSIENQKSTEIH